MLSWETFVKAERRRQSLGERHFGHFDRDAVFLHGTVENEGEAPAQINEAVKDNGKLKTAPFYLICRLVKDASSGNLKPEIKPE